MPTFVPTFSERSTENKRVAGAILWTRANRRNSTSQLTVCICAANSVAWVLTLVVEASRFAWRAVTVLGALGLA